MTDPARQPTGSNLPSGRDDDDSDFAQSLVEFETGGHTPVLPATETHPVTSAGAPKARSMESLLDIPVKVTAVLGHRRIDVETLTQLGAGAILSLDRKVGDPVDLYVNDQLVARGELVISDGGLGISMTEIIHPNPVTASISVKAESE